MPAAAHRRSRSPERPAASLRLVAFAACASALVAVGCASSAARSSSTTESAPESPAVATADPASFDRLDGVDRLGWLAGPWGLIDGDRVIEEHWMPPRGGMMLGLSRIVVGDRVVSWEHMRIETRDDELVFIAHPSGQEETMFIERSSGATSVTFENIDNEFPQRIHYEFDGRDGLLAWIEGEYDGAMRRIKFPYSRPR